MARKSALIVDDSRTARRFLARVLEQHQMRIHTAESAEEALEFLSTARPDVIFMDHQMSGMDGFQALRAIKNNPATATIPIMMYTSQSGELYVGQARALGAVGVLPKQIKPVEVSELLQNLHLVPAPSVAAPGAGAPGAAAPEEPANDIKPAMGAADWEELHSWLERLLQQQGNALRSDIEETVSRILSERLPEIPEAPEAPEPPPPPQPAPAYLTTALVLALAALSATFLWLHLDTQRKWQTVAAQNAELLAVLDSRRLDDAADTVGVRSSLDVERASLDRQYSEFLDALEWSVNQSGTYAPDEIPLGDRRLELLTGLFQRLRETGFHGRVELMVHAGDFCLVEGAGGQWELAPADVPVADCERVGWPAGEGFAAVARESIAFANFRAEQAASGDNIGLRVEDVGNVMPVYPYPANPQAATAGEWNRIAERNNRVQLRLRADADPAEMLSQELPPP